MHAADDDGGLGLAHTVVQDDVLLEAIAVGAHRLGFGAEGDAGGVVASDAVALEEIVRILVADGNAAAFVALKRVVGEESMLDAPADEQAVLGVAQGAIAAQDRMLRAAARVQAMAGVSVR